MIGYTHPSTRKPRALKLSPAQAAYIAGALDGEGTITLGLTRGRIQPLVTIAAQSNRQWLEDIQKDLGGMGSIYLSCTSKSGRDNFTLRLGSQEIAVVLPALLPYLRLKAQQARILLEFMSWPPNAGVKGGGRTNHPMARLLRDQVLRLNRTDGAKVIEKDGKALAKLGYEIPKGIA